MQRQLNNRVTLLRRISLSQRGRFDNTLKELEAAVVAIGKGDADKALSLCREHVEKSAQNVLTSMSVQVTDFSLSGRVVRTDAHERSENRALQPLH